MKTTLTIALLATLGIAAPAAAQWHEPVQQAGWNNDWDDRRGNWDDRRGDWNGQCRRSSGGTGTVVGAIAGGVIGNQVARRNDRTVATVAGAVVGGLLGRSIDRGRTVCR
jgi:opacity protein-like surface antigen